VYDKRDWTLKGRLVLEGALELTTDLHIGGDVAGMTVGSNESIFGLPDNPVVRDCYGKPFIPGSSLRGCMRMWADLTHHGDGLKKLAERLQEHWRNSGDQNDRRRAPNLKEYLPPCEKEACWVCRVFGRASHQKYREPTRLRVEDAYLVESPARSKGDVQDGLLVSVRTENAIHRLLSMANPRRNEYVPRGTTFKLRLVYTVFDKDDMNNGFPLVLTCLYHLEDSGIGGGRSRGAGGVVLKDLSVRWKSVADYKSGSEGAVAASASGIRELIQAYDSARGNISW
jgi:CRISPR-associated protein Csm3